MATKTSPTVGRIMYTPIEAFSADYEGVPTNFRPEVDRFDEFHPFVVANPQLFRVLTVNREWEAATAAPGEKR